LLQHITQLMQHASADNSSSLTAYNISTAANILQNILIVIALQKHCFELEYVKTNRHKCICRHVVQNVYVNMKFTKINVKFYLNSE